MEEFQVVMAKLSGKGGTDEEMLTDLLNERERTGWHFRSATALGTSRLLVVFSRQT